MVSICSHEDVHADSLSVAVGRLSSDSPAGWPIFCTTFTYGHHSGKKLIENRGVTLVDEIDLLLHPKWQMHVIRTVAKAFPNMQFIFTSHSPLVAGSLEWMNIITLKAGAKTNRTAAKRLRRSIHGLDADQILLSELFGLRTTMASSKRKHLTEITNRIRSGEKGAPLQLIREMASGTEEEG